MDRESLSQALERVRQAARQRKKEQFTSLLRHVNPAMFRTAFYAMKRDAAPGVDGMTRETYERDLVRCRFGGTGGLRDGGQICNRRSQTL
jgi:RNA-directed DNA polymerase